MFKREIFLNENKHLSIVAMYTIPLLVDDMRDSTEQLFAVYTGAGCSEVLACYTGKSREAGLVALPVAQRAFFREDGDFSQVCMHLKKK